MQLAAKNCSYFQIAGITVGVESDLDFDVVAFKQELTQFAVADRGDDNVTIRHFFQLPDLTGWDLGKEIYRKAPWAIWRNGDRWYYIGISAEPDDPQLHRVAVFNADHTHATVYSMPYHENLIRDEGFHSLSLLPTDQIWLIPLLADRNAALLHSAGVILNGQGLLFAGRSEAGKSTTVTMLQNLQDIENSSESSVEILCDDRNIARRWDAGWRLHGTWSHGDIADVSPGSAPLRAVLFLEQASFNDIVPITNRKEIWHRLLPTLIKPMVTAEWWQKELDVLEQLVNQVPCYTMHFDTRGDIVRKLVELTANGTAHFDKSQDFIADPGATLK